MRQERGVVLEVKDGRAVVLTPEGDFVRLRVPAEQWLAGQEVTWGARPWFSWRPALALACSLLLLLGGGGVTYQHYFALGPVVAYVSVDINPSLELGVDRRERVCTAEGLNEDGAKLLEGLRFRRRPLQLVLADLTLRAAERGYLSGEEEGEVLITVTPVPSPAQARVRTSDPALAPRDTPPVPPPTTPSQGPAAPPGHTPSPPTQPGAPPVQPGTSPALPGQPGTSPAQPGASPVRPEGADVPGKGGSAPGKDGPGAGAGRRDGSRDAASVETKIRQEAEAVAARVLKEHGLKAAVHALTTDAALRDEARELKMSAGRLALYLTARDAGLDIPLDKLRQGSLTQVFREALENLKSLPGRKDSQPPASGEPATTGKPDQGRISLPSVAVPPEHGSGGKPDPQKGTAPASGQKKGAPSTVTPHEGDGEGGSDGSQGSAVPPGTTVVPPGKGKADDKGGGGLGSPPQRPGEVRPGDDKATGIRPPADKPSGDKAEPDKAGGEKPGGQKPGGEKPGGGKPGGEKPKGEEGDADKPGELTPDNLREKWREKWKQMFERPDLEKELRGLLQKFTELGGHRGEPGEDKGPVLRPDQNR